MNTKMPKTLARITAVVAKRQSVLDFLTEHPYSTPQAVIEALGWTEDVDLSRRFLRSMVNQRELQRHGQPKDTRYTAIRATTRSVDELMANIVAGVDRSTETRKRNSQPARPRQKQDRYIRGTDGLLRLVHRSGGEDDAPLKNQGGQGAARPRRATYLETAG
jgi:hypothetical protein